MDHKLAIVIVPAGSPNPLETSAALLDSFQQVPLDSVSPHFQPKFRFKRVGGWFDGLASGRPGQERWSTVLRMVLNGEPTSALHPLPGFGPETSAEIERRMAADNTIELDDLWPEAPVSIIVTPDGRWIAHPHADDLDDSASGLAFDSEQAVGRRTRQESWTGTMEAAVQEHQGAKAVAWDLSWHFIGTPAEATRSSTQRTRRPWKRTNRSGITSRESWTTRIGEAKAGIRAWATGSPPA